MSALAEWRAQPVDGYWLEHCEGFRVEGPRGRLGVVERVLRDGEGRVSGIVVLGGLLGTRRRVESVDAIEAIVPAAQTIRLGASASAGGGPATERRTG
ncbi:MAG TPA: hypothetical protein VFB26_07230 [Gaiellaceae bacterium]|nr:hypothetical protein [Gaiellaceae bacterium]